VEKITLTYLNIRQSIAILIARLVLIDIVLAVIVVGVYYLVVQSGLVLSDAALGFWIFITIFGLTGLVKILITIYVVLLWLNEYYEITPEYIYHKKGIIFKKKEQYRIDHIRRITVEDSFLGEMFNFATVTLYDIRFQKYLDMYLIHNARRYAKILQQLQPEIEIKEDHVWMPFLKREEFNEGEDVNASADNK